jgi:hypothetical protein
MKKRAVVFIILLSCSSLLFSQAPLWKVNEPAFQYTMTIVAKLNMDGAQLASPNDLVAAFVGTNCRGVSGLTYVTSTKSYCAYLTVFSNTPGEPISFQLYNSVNGKITKVAKTINFEANQNIGNLFQSYSIAEPALNNKAEILSFDFLNIKSLSSSITSGSVKINISQIYPLDKLTPVFTLSKGANLYKNKVLQTTGTTADNFTTPLVYEVLSEDQSTLATYTINVAQTSLFYKKDAVCSTLGAIKVVSKREGEKVTLSYNGNMKEIKKITSGEAVFLNLISGTYVANIGDEYKVIVVNLK